MVDEKALAELMKVYERRAARIGLRSALPEDKQRRVWREPLTKKELHLLNFLREQKIMSATEISGAMDEDIKETRKALQSLIDRDYVKVVSDLKGYAKYRARTKNEL